MKSAAEIVHTAMRAYFATLLGLASNPALKDAVRAVWRAADRVAAMR